MYSLLGELPVYQIIVMKLQSVSIILNINIAHCHMYLIQFSAMVSVGGKRENCPQNYKIKYPDNNTTYPPDVQLFDIWMISNRICKNVEGKNKSKGYSSIQVTREYLYFTFRKADVTIMNVYYYRTYLTISCIASTL